MPRPPVNLQDAFLNQARRGGVRVHLHLVNGRELEGVVKAFDSFTILLDREGRQDLVYKHAIAAITPPEPLGVVTPE